MTLSFTTQSLVWPGPAPRPLPYIPVKGLREKHIAADLTTLDPNPANGSLKCWRLIFAQAKVDNAIETDPSLGIKKAQTKSTGHAAWSQHDVDRFREHWRPGTRQRAAFELLAWTGARVSDAATMCRSHIASDGLISFRQQKTGGLAHVPWTSPLPAWARAWDAERVEVRAIVMATAGFTLLETSLGKARAAGISGKTPHGLRKYRLSTIAESGGSAHAIMAWGGHASLAEAEAYTRSANRKAVVIGMEQEQNAVNDLKIP